MIILSINVDNINSNNEQWNINVNIEINECVWM